VHEGIEYRVEKEKEKWTLAHDEQNGYRILSQKKNLARGKQNRSTREHNIYRVKKEKGNIIMVTLNKIEKRKKDIEVRQDFF